MQKIISYSLHSNMECDIIFHINIAEILQKQEDVYGGDKNYHINPGVDEAA